MDQAFLRLALALAAVGGMACPGGARADNGVTPVIVQNPVTLNPAAPNPVTVGNPGDIAKAMGVEHPLEFFQRALFTDNSCALTVTLPAKQRAVIEYVTGSTSLPPGTPLVSASLFTSADNSLTPVSFQAGLGGTAHSLIVADHVGIDDTFGTKVVVFAQTVRAYADAGSEIIVVLTTPFHGPNPSAFCFISMSGQLIDVP
jgi:hypothetical protein